MHRGGEDAVRRAADRREVPERVQEALAVGDQAGLRAVEELVVDAEVRDARQHRTDDVIDPPGGRPRGDQDEPREEASRSSHAG